MAALSTPEKSNAILFRARQTLKIRRVAANGSMIIIQLENCRRRGLISSMKGNTARPINSP
jgi:hypothetical protein